MPRLRGRPLVLWTLVTAVVAGISYVVDVNTGAKTGPPYDDPWYNVIAFLVNRGSIAVLFVLVVVALIHLVLRAIRRVGASKTG